MPGRTEPTDQRYLAWLGLLAWGGPDVQTTRKPLASKGLAFLVRTYHPRPLVVRRWHVTREGSTVGFQFDRKK